MSIIVLGSYSDFLVSALRRVQSELGHTVDFWSAAPQNVEKIKGLFPDTIVTNCVPLTRADTLEFCRACKDIEPNYGHLSSEFIDSHSYEREYVLNCLLHRADPGGAFTLEEIRDTLNDYFFIATNLLDHFKPNLIYLDVIPHAMYDLAIYLLAKKRNIKTIVMMGTFIGRIGFIAHSLDDSLSDYTYCPDAKYGNAEKVSFIDEALAPNHNLFYMKKSEPYNRNILGLAKSIVSALYSYIRIKIKDRGSKPEDGYEKAGGALMRDVVGRRGIVKYAIYSAYHELIYRAMALRGMDRLKTAHKYIFIPLSLQIEATTMPAAGAMYDQKAYIRLLTSLLPGDVCVVVKEHPAQFSNNTGVLARSKRFYKDLENMGVIFADIDHPSSDLISNALCTVVTTGTAGFQSVYNYNKPVLSFSKSWYVDMPGVTLVRSKADLQRFIKRLLSDGISIDRSAVQQYTDEIKEKSIYLYFDWPTIEAHGWDSSHMGRNLYAVFKQELSTL